MLAMSKVTRTGLGDAVGIFVGVPEGKLVAIVTVGEVDGYDDGNLLGSFDGEREAPMVGCAVGNVDGAPVGD